MPTKYIVLAILSPAWAFMSSPHITSLRQVGSRLVVVASQDDRASKYNADWLGPYPSSKNNKPPSAPESNEDLGDSPPPSSSSQSPGTSAVDAARASSKFFAPNAPAGTDRGSPRGGAQPPPPSPPRSSPVPPRSQLAALAHQQEAALAMATEDLQLATQRATQTIPGTAAAGMAWGLVADIESEIAMIRGSAPRPNPQQPGDGLASFSRGRGQQQGSSSPASEGLGDESGKRDWRRDSGGDEWLIGDWHGRPGEREAPSSFTGGRSEAGRVVGGNRRRNPPPQEEGRGDMRSGSGEARRGSSDPRRRERLSDRMGPPMPDNTDWLPGGMPPPPSSSSSPQGDPRDSMQWPSLGRSPRPPPSSMNGMEYGFEGGGLGGSLGDEMNGWPPLEGMPPRLSSGMRGENRNPYAPPEQQQYQRGPPLGGAPYQDRGSIEGMPPPSAPPSRPSSSRSTRSTRERMNALEQQEQGRGRGSSSTGSGDNNDSANANDVEMEWQVALKAAYRAIADPTEGGKPRGAFSDAAAAAEEARAAYQNKSSSSSSAPPMPMPPLKEQEPQQEQQQGNSVPLAGAAWAARVGAAASRVSSSSSGANDAASTNGVLSVGECTLVTKDAGAEIRGAYFGEMKFGTAHGQGEAVWTGINGREVGWFQGYFKSGKMHGQGTFQWANGDKYAGEWLNDMAHGKGTLTRRDGTIVHSGQWAFDEPAHRTWMAPAPSTPYEQDNEEEEGAFGGLGGMALGGLGGAGFEGGEGGLEELGGRSVPPPFSVADRLPGEPTFSTMPPTTPPPPGVGAPSPPAASTASSATAAALSASPPLSSSTGRVTMPGDLIASPVSSKRAPAKSAPSSSPQAEVPKKTSTVAKAPTAAAPKTSPAPPSGFIKDEEEDAFEAWPSRPWMALEDEDEYEDEEEDEEVSHEDEEDEAWENGNLEETIQYRASVAAAEQAERWEWFENEKSRGFEAGSKGGARGASGRSDAATAAAIGKAQAAAFDATALSRAKKELAQAEEAKAALAGDSTRGASSTKGIQQKQPQPSLQQSEERRAATAAAAAPVGEKTKEDKSGISTKNNDNDATALALEAAEREAAAVKEDQVAASRLAEAEAKAKALMEQQTTKSNKPAAAAANSASSKSASPPPPPETASASAAATPASKAARSPPKTKAPALPSAASVRDALSLKTRTLLEVTAGELARALDAGIAISPNEALLVQDVAELADLLLQLPPPQPLESQSEPL